MPSHCCGHAKFISSWMQIAITNDIELRRHTMRYGFHRICFPCPQRLPAPCSTASDELINIIKANMPHHTLPAKAGRLAFNCELSGRPGGGWHWRENQTWRAARKNCQVKREEMKGKEKRERERGSLFRPWPHRSAIQPGSALSGTSER